MSDIQQLVSLIAGDYIDAKNQYQVAGFLDYLVEAGVDQIQLAELYHEKWLTKYTQLPKELWENSLLKPYTYYYHSKLRQLSKPCSLDIRTGIFTEIASYNEMRIVLTHEQVIDDMYLTVGTLPEFQHKKRDVEGLKYILEKHPISFAGPLTLQTIDIIYMIFDKAKTTSMGCRANFLNLFGSFYESCLTTTEEMCITPQKSFVLRTGELVTCHGK